MYRENKAIRWLKAAFSLDTRSLGLLRIGLAVSLIWDIADRLPDIQNHYSDAGLYPICILGDTFWNFGWQYSLHTLSGDSTWQLALFVGSLVASTLLLIGWKTRYVTVLCWLLLCSLHARNPAVLHGGDALLRSLLLFSIFLPLGARFSVDSLRNTRNAPTCIVNMASVGLYGQVAAIYSFSLFFKTDPMWRENFDAIWYTFNYDFIAKPFASWLTHYPGLTRAMTISTLVLESVGPMLLILSGRRPIVRLLLIASFMVFHGVIWSSIAIGSFSAVCMIAWIAFLPSAFWNHLSASKTGEQTIETYGAWPSQIIPAIALCLILTWNSLLLEKDAKAEALPGMLKWAVRTPMLNQRWMAFSNEQGLRWSGWLEIEGTTTTGERVDLIDERNLKADPTPGKLHARWPNERWRKGVQRYLSSGASGTDQDRFCQFFADRWNRKNPQNPVDTVRVLYRVQWIHPPGESPARGPMQEHVFFERDGLAD